MQNNTNSPLLDPKMILAFAFMGLTLFGWQYYLQKKYPEYYKPKSAAKSATQPVGTPSVPGTVTAATSGSAAAPQPELAAPVSASPGAAVPENAFKVENERFSAELSSKGMALRKIVLKRHLDRQKQPMVLAKTGEGSFGTQVIGANQFLNFEVSEKGTNHFVGVAFYNSTRITKSMKYDPAIDAWDVDISLDNVEAGFPGVRTVIADQRTLGQHSLFAPSVEFQDVAVNFGGVLERIFSQSDLETPDQSFTNTSFASLGLRYFALAVVDSSRLRAATSMQIPEVEGQTAYLFLDHKLAPGIAQNSFSMKAYAGPKKIETLNRIDPELGKIVDLGFFDTIGKILRSILVWFQTYVGNWGIAIILLTIIVRLVVLPFNIVAYRSMKAMQVIQPAMQAIREKYKDDPAAMQRETMSLMREKKVNPLGGCLPMLLQMPIFFALFQLLNVSVELYQAPFYLWIHDLSSADPFYVFPVLIGGLIWIQQKLTPAPMDPAQAKVLQWMPLLFVVFMVALPAGLAIYTLVNTLFGVVQQYIFVNKSKSSESNMPSGVLSGKSV